MGEHADPKRFDETEPEPDSDPNASMSGVGVPTNRGAINGLGYTGDDAEPGPADVNEHDETSGTEDRPAG
jgi:hypothetical protein